jgi:hypothetical protein
MAVAEHLEAFLSAQALDEAGEVKAAAARALAHAIDALDDTKTLPPLVKELRATLDDLAPKVADDGNDWTASVAGVGSLLSAVRDPEGPDTQDARPSRRGGGRKAG